MVDTKEIIRVLGFIQEYFDNHADEQEPDCRKELFRDWSEITLDAIILLKAQDEKSVHVTANINHRKIGVCPNCGVLLNSDYYPNYCGKCGQAVKWE